MGIFPCLQNLSLLRRVEPVFSIVHDRKLGPMMPGKFLHCLAGSHIILSSIQDTDRALPVMDWMFPHIAEISP